jgi:hypothetical protein
MSPWTLDAVNVEGEKGDKQRIVRAIDALVELEQGRKRVSAMGDLITLHDCIISDLQIPRKTEDGEGVVINVTFEQITTVFAKDTEAPTAPEFQKLKASGSKAAEYSDNYEAEAAKSVVSLAYDAANGITP